MSADELLVEKRGEVEWVTLNRPDSLNALNSSLTKSLRTYFETKYDDMSTRVIVLRGAGRAFCAGLDLKDVGGGGQSVEESLRKQVSVRDIYKAMRRCPQPIVSLIRGAACGGGFSLALASDIRILGESAKMNAAYITIGASGCDMGSSYFLPRLVGTSLASELLLTGRFIYPAEALAHRLVSRVVPDAELDTAADDLIAAILANTRFGVSLTKDALNFSIDAPGLDAAMAMEDRNQMLAISSGEFAARVKAFTR
ncbi:MAG: enoyl-CoA hydratase/isomerase family protein [Pseudomonadales bacterium]|nr:enoyl-CoA hydratase/isomerase family protein [Pseudomonadales bacterium]MCP5183063.1 enoyl-CoA hydratase/isomerase family protein [Pseudomonadales bacterium]